MFAISLYPEALHSEYPTVVPIYMTSAGMPCVSVPFARRHTMGPSSGYRLGSFAFNLIHKFSSPYTAVI